MYAGRKQRFVCVDVTDAANQAGVHDKVLHRSWPAVRRPVQVCAVEFVAQRFRPQVPQQSVVQRMS
jgi:hypothetical protein